MKLKILFLFAILFNFSLQQTPIVWSELEAYIDDCIMEEYWDWENDTELFCESDCEDYISTIDITILAPCDEVMEYVEDGGNDLSDISSDIAYKYADCLQQIAEFTWKFPTKDVYYCASESVRYHLEDSDIYVIVEESDLQDCKDTCEDDNQCDQDCLDLIDDEVNLDNEQCDYADEYRQDEIDDGIITDSQYTTMSMDEYGYCYSESLYTDLESIAENIDWDSIYENWDWEAETFDFSDESTEVKAYFTFECQTYCHWDVGREDFDYWETNWERAEDADWDWGDDYDMYEGDDWGGSFEEDIEYDDWEDDEVDNCEKYFCFQELFDCLDDCDKTICPGGTCLRGDMDELVEQNCAFFVKTQDDLIEQDVFYPYSVAPFVYTDDMKTCAEHMLEMQIQQENRAGEKYFECVIECSVKADEENQNARDGESFQTIILFQVSAFIAIIMTLV